MTSHYTHIEAEAHKAAAEAVAKLVEGAVVTHECSQNVPIRTMAGRRLPTGDFPDEHRSPCLCWWRRRTGIEPASDAARRSLVLKTRGPTRNPDASAPDFTESSP